LLLQVQQAPGGGHQNRCSLSSNSLMVQRKSVFPWVE
jgi:hypothetical protein